MVQINQLDYLEEIYIFANLSHVSVSKTFRLKPYGQSFCSHIVFLLIYIYTQFLLIYI